MLLFRIKKPFKCKCGKSYKSAQGLRNHSLLRHPSLELPNVLQQKTVKTTMPSPVSVSLANSGQGNMTITHHIPLAQNGAQLLTAATQNAGHVHNVQNAVQSVQNAVQTAVQNAQNTVTVQNTVQTMTSALQLQNSAAAGKISVSFNIFSRE